MNLGGGPLDCGVEVLERFDPDPLDCCIEVLECVDPLIHFREADLAASAYGREN